MECTKCGKKLEAGMAYWEGQDLIMCKDCRATTMALTTKVLIFAGIMAVFIDLTMLWFFIIRPSQGDLSRLIQNPLENPLFVAFFFSIISLPIIFVFIIKRIRNRPPKYVGQDEYSAS